MAITPSSIGPSGAAVPNQQRHCRDWDNRPITRSGSTLPNMAYASIEAVTRFSPVIVMGSHVCSVGVVGAQSIVGKYPI